jgi:hypothetical protein
MRFTVRILVVDATLALECNTGAMEYYVTQLNTPIHNILSTAPPLGISQKTLGTLPEDGNVMPKHVGFNIHNYK